jgi:hypothetical protein
MRKRLVRKTFDMIQDLAEGENKEVSVNNAVSFIFQLELSVLWTMNTIYCDFRITKNSGRTLVGLLSWDALRTVEIISA